jgi:tRNA-specific 2-thiouridylase
MDVKGKRIFVGLSGGVDSAVTAALLKGQGANVVGVFIKGWYPHGMPCTWSEDRKDAMRVAARLSIPFVTLDASEEYKRGVIDYLLSEYRAGRTPNPDVMCNREVKFGAFYRFAKEKGADFIATGHYARTNGGKLFRGVDAGKDQSYFLWAVPQEALSKTLFPLGGLKKDITRTLARKYGLPNAAKRDSQGICFLGSISVEDFLRSEFGSEQGEAIDVSGAVVGMHSGALLHTLGSRVPLENAQPGPWYVVRKDIERNQLIVSKERNVESSTGSLQLTDTNWFTEDTSGIPSAQFRYHGPLIEGMLSEDRGEFRPSLPFPEPLASGQSLVLYRGEELLGGGILTI